MDARRGEAARPARRARHDPRAGARAGGRGGRVGAVRLRAGGLRAARRAQALPQLSEWPGIPSSATHPRPTRTCGSSSTTSRRWRRAREGRRQRGRALLRRRGREGPARRALDARPPDRDPAADRPGDGPLALQGQPRAGARRGRAGDLPRHARRGPERLELARALDARDVDRRPDGVLRDARGAAAGAARHRDRRRDRGPAGGPDTRISSTGSCSSAPSPATATRARSPSSTGSAGRRRERSRPATSPTRRSSTSPSSCASACRSTRGRRCRPTRSRGSR